MIRLFHCSDLHFGAEDSGALAWFVRAVRAAEPDAVIVTGDLTMRARAHEFAAASAWLAGLNVPVTVQAGNHDLPYFNPVERFLSPYRRFGAVAASVGRELDLPGAAIVPLKTTARAQWRLNWSKGSVSSRALARTAAALDGLPADRLRIVAAHHPLAEAQTRGSARTRGGAGALAALAERGVAAVLSGHVHDPFDVTVATPAGEVRMIGAGTLSERVRESRPAFNELRIAGGAIEVVVHRMG